MKSRTFCCDAAILKRTIRKGLPLWGAYLVLLLVIMPMILYSDRSWTSVVDYQDHILSIAAHGSQIFGAAYGLAAACLVFSWMYKSRSANFFGALPVTRAGLFCTNYLAGLLFAVVPHGIVTLLCLPLAITWGVKIVTALGTWFVVMTLIYVFYYSFAVLLAMIVGNLIALPLLYGVLNFTAIVVELIVRDLMEYFIFGLCSTRRLLFDWASPLYYTVIQGDGPDVFRHWRSDAPGVMECWFEGWPMVLIMGAVGIAFALLAFLLHKYRRMESAGDVIAVRHLKPVFLYCFTVGCSIVLGYALANLLLSGSIGTEDFVGVLLCMLVGAFAGYFSGQMMLHKSMRVFRKRHWLNWGVTALCITAVLLCVRFDVFGYARYIPDQDEIEAANLGYNGDFYEDPAFISQVMELHQQCVDRQQETEQSDPQGGFNRCYISYLLKDGTMVERQYLLPVSPEHAQDANSLIRRYEAAYNNPGYKVIRCLPKDYEAADIESCHIYTYSGTQKELLLTRQETYEFMKTCLEPDLRESCMKNVDYAEYTYGWTAEYTDLNVEITFKEKSPNQENYSRYYYFNVTSDAEHILAYALEKGIEPTINQD